MIGTVLRIRYELTSLTKDGPIFSTYLASDRVSGRQVSVRLFKEPFASESGFMRAIEIAAKRTASITHPGIERLDGLDEDENRKFLVGMASPGTYLSDRIARLAPFSVPVAVQTAITILEGLDALHSAGAVHGDVSSQNIVILADGSARLQLAEMWRSYASSDTAGSVVLPSMAAYLAPEVAAGSLPSRQSDVYSTGVILHELVCGRLPYSADTPVSMAMKHATAPIPSIRTYAPSAPSVLDEIVKKALSKDPSDRYNDAAEMLADLRMLQDGLRFGKSLTWPLRKPSPVAGGPHASSSQAAMAPASKSTKSSKSTKPSAPAVPPPTSRPMRGGDDRDVPTWLVNLVIFFAAILVVGAFFGYLYLNSTQAKRVTLPNLVGMDVTAARTQLKSIHLDLRVESTRTDDSHPAQTIVEMDPTANDKVAVGSVVNVIVSSGSKQVAVPDLGKLQVDQASTVLKDLGLTLNPATQTGPSNTVGKGEVISQNPPPNTLVNQGTAVSVTLSNGQTIPTVPAATDGTTGNANPTSGSTPSPAGTSDSSGANAGATTTGTASSPTPPSNPATTPPSPAKTTPPPVSPDQQHFYSVRIRLSDTDHPVQLKVTVQDSVGTRTILDEPHDANDVVSVQAIGYGPKATFRVYYDGQLRKTVTQRAGAAQ